MLMPGRSQHCVSIPDRTSSGKHFTQSKDNEHKEDIKTMKTAVQVRRWKYCNRETKKHRDENAGRHFSNDPMSEDLPRPF